MGSFSLYTRQAARAQRLCNIGSSSSRGRRGLARSLFGNLLPGIRLQELVNNVKRDKCEPTLGEKTRINIFPTQLLNRSGLVAWRRRICVQELYDEAAFGGISKFPRLIVTCHSEE
ncbi:unnamed protein product [Sphagnum tenellum]